MSECVSASVKGIQDGTAKFLLLHLKLATIAAFNMCYSYNARLHEFCHFAVFVGTSITLMQCNNTNLICQNESQTK